MINSIVKIMGFAILLILCALLSACRDDNAQPLPEKTVVTVAFKVPISDKLPAPSSPKEITNKEVMKNNESPLSSEKENMSPEIEAYSGEGKIDPFEPLIKVETKQAIAQGEPVKLMEKPERILTPLEKLDYSQMKLVAIINADAGSVAMVEEAGGKGYVVGLGTNIGRDGGTVVEIQKDKIVILERLRDYKGKIIKRTQEMKLNKTEDGSL